MKNLLAAVSAPDIGNQFFGGTNTGFSSLTGIGNIVSLFLKIAMVLAGLILFFYFILGGIGMIGSAGQNDPAKAEEAKKTLTTAVIGLVIVLASYWIVQLISIITGIPILQ